MRGFTRGRSGTPRRSKSKVRRERDLRDGEEKSLRSVLPLDDGVKIQIVGHQCLELGQRSIEFCY